MELMQCNQNWATRPDDEKFLSLPAIADHTRHVRDHSKARVIPNRALEFVHDEKDSKALSIVGPAGVPFAPTHWSFGQLAQLADAPPSYLRKLPGLLAAANLNYGMRKRDVEEVGILIYSNGSNEVRAATGPNYGRIWNDDIINGLIRTVGDGVTGQWKVPGEFGKAVEVTKENTTLYASDRDMFVFLADETNRIEVPNRRNGQSGEMSRGFFVWNSEVGSTSFGVSTFLFDYVCCNRIVWGATDIKEIRMRHSSGAPQRFLEEVTPALTSYARSSAANLLEGIAKAKAARLEDADEWLAKRYTKAFASQLQAVHLLEEQRPIENLWDVSTAITAKARGITWQDERVKQEREAGVVLSLAR